jgi:hypothetical protein
MHAHAGVWVWHWHVGVVYYIKSTLALQSEVALSICKLAAAKVHISHIASKAGGLRGMLAFLKCFVCLMFFTMANEPNLPQPQSGLTSNMH